MCLYLIPTTTVCNSNRLEINEMSINRGLIQRNYGTTEPQKKRTWNTRRGQWNTLQNVHVLKYAPACVKREREEQAHKLWTGGRFCSHTLWRPPSWRHWFFCSYFSQEGFSLFTFLFLLNSKPFWDLVIQKVCQLHFKIMENTENTAKMSNLGQVS